MKKLLLATSALVLLNMPATAALYHLDSGSYTITGDMSGGADVTFAADGNVTLMPQHGGPTTSFFSSAFVIQMDGFPQGFVAIGLTQDCMCDAPSGPPITYHLDDQMRNFQVWNVSSVFNVAASITFLDFQLPDQLALVNQNGPVAAVPETSTWLMMLLGFVGVGLVRAAKHYTGLKYENRFTKP